MAGRQQHEQHDARGQPGLRPETQAAVPDPRRPLRPWSAGSTAPEHAPHVHHRQDRRRSPTKAPSTTPRWARQEPGAGKVNYVDKAISELTAGQQGEPPEHAALRLHGQVRRSSNRKDGAGRDIQKALSRRLAPSIGTCWRERAFLITIPPPAHSPNAAEPGIATNVMIRRQRMKIATRNATRFVYAF